MKTVAYARTEKNLENAKQDHLDAKRKRLNSERITYLKSKIEEEKKAIKDCLDQNYFSMAQSCLNRIGRLKDQIDELNIRS